MNDYEKIILKAYNHVKNGGKFILKQRCQGKRYKMNYKDDDQFKDLSVDNLKNVKDCMEAYKEGAKDTIKLIKEYIEFSIDKTIEIYEGKIKFLQDLINLKENK